jgi:hypothetical protein
MKTYNKVLALCPLAAALLIVAACNRAEPRRVTVDLPGPPNPEQAAILPVLRLDGRSDTAIEVDLQNRSQQPIRYLHGSPDTTDGGGMRDLRVLLQKDGRLLAYKVTPKSSLEDRPEMVRELKPGQHVRHSARFPGLYLSVEPGTYELVAKYNVLAESGRTKELGLTPMSFNRVVAIVEVEK